MSVKALSEPGVCMWPARYVTLMLCKEQSCITGLCQHSSSLLCNAAQSRPFLMTLSEFLQMSHAALIAYCHPLQQWTACCHLPMHLQVHYVNARCSLSLQLHHVHPHRFAVQVCKIHGIPYVGEQHISCATTLRSYMMLHMLPRSC